MNLFDITKIESQTIIDNARILIVDDDRIARHTLQVALEEQGFRHITEAVNGEEALEKTKQIHPHLVILDMTMPVMDGFAYCRQIRKVPEFVQMPILVQSMLSEAKEKAEIFAVGATDYIVKPIDPVELIARSMIHLERAFLLEDLQNYRSKMQRELESARRMQQILMPNDNTIAALAKGYNIDIHAHFQPSSSIGGDFWGSRALSDSTMALWHVDFSGHGVDSALNTFRLHTLMQQSNLPHPSNPGEYLAALNRNLKPLLPPELYATMFFGVIDVRNNALRYAVAGCPAPIVFHENGAEYQIIDPKGFPLGVIDEASYESKEVSFGPTDSLFLYSDALTETPSQETGEFLGVDWIATTMQQCFGGGETGRGAFDHLIGYFQSQCMSYLNDDLTLTLFERRTQ